MSAVKEITFKYLRFFGASRAVVAMSVISVIGIAIAVATITMSYSVAKGFGDQYRDAILKFNAHVALLSTDEIPNAASVEERLKKFPEITEAKPFLYREGLLVFNGEVRGVVIKGVATGREGIILGSQLASEIKAAPGDKIKLMLQGSNFEEMTVADVFNSGMYDVDSEFVLMDLPAAQKIFNKPGTVSGIEIKIRDWRDAEQFARKLETEFEYPLYASSWQELNRSLFDAVKLEKIMFIIIMGAFVIVATFNIIGTIMLRVLYKTSDISILRALGLNAGKLRWIFTLQGFLVGAVGTILGIGISLALLLSIQKFGWIRLPSEIYLLDTLPICISFNAIVGIALFSFFISLLTAFIASKKAAELPIVKGLHQF